MNLRLFAAAIAASCLVATSAACGAADKAEPLSPLHYLREAEVSPSRLTAPRAPKDSVALQREMAHLREVIAAATSERLVQAKADGENESPSIFDSASGVKISTMPTTSRLLTAIGDEADAVIERAKRHFAEPRPYQIDPTLPHCGKGNTTFRGYPSGHAGIGYSVGWALAGLLPARATQILARAEDYAFSREVCGVDFHTDIEASHVIGTVVAERMLADPRLAKTVRDARRELSEH